MARTFPCSTLSGARAWFLWVCAAAYLAASLGVFPSAGLLRKWGVLSTPADADFPCSGHDCGCLSAEVCWHGCCCFTLDERREWAAEHGAYVPRWARVTALSAPTGTDRPPSPCCAHKDRGAGTTSSDRWTRVMTGLSCRGVQAWLVTGVPPTFLEDPVRMILAGGPARPERAEPALAGQNSLDPPSPPPRWV